MPCDDCKGRWCDAPEDQVGCPRLPPSFLNWLYSGCQERYLEAHELRLLTAERQKE